MEVWAVLVALAGGFVWRVLAYNRFVLQLQQVQATWSEIDGELRRRFDAVPAIVDLVRPYAGREVDLLERVLDARAAALRAAGSPAALAAALAPFEALLARLVDLAGSVPEVRDGAAFRRLEEELAMTEDRIAGRRGVYNGRVADLNRRVRAFPSSLVARVSGIGEAEYFRVGPVA
ncbi:MAG: LemA family protein [Actinomycetota bacterium]